MERDTESRQSTGTLQGGGTITKEITKLPDSTRNPVDTKDTSTDDDETPTDDDMMMSLKKKN